MKIVRIIVAVPVALMGLLVAIASSIVAPMFLHNLGHSLDGTSHYRDPHGECMSGNMFFDLLSFLSIFLAPIFIGLIAGFITNLILPRGCKLTDLK